jgi:hypothetical protein
MLLPPSPSRYKTLAAALGVCVQTWSTANSQDFTKQIADSAILGLLGGRTTGEIPGILTTDGIKGGFSSGVGVSSLYDSNLFLERNGPQSELTTIIAPTIRYVTDPEGGAPLSFTAGYQPVARAYLENPDLNGVDHSGDIVMKIEGSKTSISAFTRYDTTSGTDRLTGEFVTSNFLSAGILGVYQIGTKTSAFAGLASDVSDYESSNLVGYQIYSAQIGTFWSVTELLSIGPSLNYTNSKSDNTGEREAWALTMQARYIAANTLVFLASLGIDYAEISRQDGNGTAGLTGSMTANYSINERWIWMNSVRYVTVPSANEMNYFLNNFVISTALNRSLQSATIGGGLDLNLSEYEEASEVKYHLGDEKNLSLFIHYKRNVFSERIGFQSMVRYSLNDGRVDWSQVQVSAGLKFQF